MFNWILFGFSYKVLIAKRKLSIYAYILAFTYIPIYFEIYDNYYFNFKLIFYKAKGNFYCFINNLTY